MPRRPRAILASAALVAALAACAAHAQQELRDGLRPPPAYEREYQSFCRERPAACAGGYGQARDEFLTRRHEEAVETIRRREQDALQLQQQRSR